MPTILTPIHSDVLHLVHEQTVVSAQADFTRLPYFDGERDINPDAPYLAETIVNKPFENDNLTLKAGVHLHWVLPKALNTSVKGTNGKEFPAVPNRWLIQREGDNIEHRSWIVESDFLWPEKTGFGAGAISIPVPPDQLNGERTQPFRFMGRQLPLEDWLREPYNENREYWSDLMGKPLTAMGWGTPSFDTFYPNCSSVFGFFDGEITAPIEKEKKITYTLLGWYDDPSLSYPNFLNSKEIVTTLEDLEKELKWILKKGKKTTYKGELPLNLMCYSRVELKADSHVESEKQDSFHITIANSGTESVSVAIAENISDDAEEKKRFEAQIEAILFGQKMINHQVDVGAKFNEMRHEKGFNAVPSGTSWTIKSFDLASDDKNPVTIPEIPEEIYVVLHHLNSVQENYDRIQFELEDLYKQLYADWCKYMVCAYPEPGEKENLANMDLVKKHIERTSIETIEWKEGELGKLVLPEEVATNTGKLGKFEVDQNDSSLATEIGRTYNILWDMLEKFNAKIAHKNVEKVLQRASPPRYWIPKDPVVLISGRKNKKNEESEIIKTPPLLKQEDAKGRSTLNCFVVEKAINPSKDKLLFDVQAAIDQIDMCQPNNGTTDGFFEPEGTPWHPFKLEWKSELFPAIGNPLDSTSGEYSADYIDRNYILAENNVDFVDHFDANHSTGYSRSASIFSGFSYLTPTSGDELEKALSDFYTTNRDTSISLDDQHPAVRVSYHGRDWIKSNNVLTQSMGGFNNALIQMHSMMRLPANDPLGFTDYREFASRVRTFLPGGKGFGPDLLSDFHPMRAGAMKMLNLRIIDTFGRIATIPTETIGTSDLQKIGGQPSWIKLQPRLAVPARINFRFLATKKEEELREDPENSPICGWFLPNYLNSSIDVFSASGSALGSVDLNGNWEPAVQEGERVVTADLEDMSSKKINPHLAKTVNWLMKCTQNDPPDRSTEKRGFFDTFLAEIEDTIDNIYPEDASGKDALIMLVGRPLAVVRASLNIELKGLEPTSQLWADFRNELNGAKRTSRGLTAIKFPMRIGEFNQLNDSLVGFWKETDASIENENFTINNSLSAQILNKERPDFVNWPEASLNAAYTLLKDRSLIHKQEFIQSIENGAGLWEDLKKEGWILEEEKHSKIQHYSDATALEQSLQDPSTVVTMLMEPHGRVHLTSGILPVKSIAIPSKYYNEALKKIEIAFLNTPLLTPRKRLQMLLPNETGYEWYWEQKDGKGHVIETGAAPKIRKNIFVIKINALEGDLEGESVWSILLDPKVAWLTHEIEGWAHLVPAVERKMTALPDPLAGREDEIQLVLDQNKTSIETSPSTAQFHGPQQLSEGWIKLKTS